MLLANYRSFIRPLVAVAALAGLAAYATIMLRGPKGLSVLAEKQQEIRAMEEQNADLQRDIEAKKQRIERLKNDPGTQEVELEKLGLMRQHDTQFRITGQRIPPNANATKSH